MRRRLVFYSSAARACKRRLRPDLPRSRRLALEPLEDRRLLAIATLVGSDLQIDFTATGATAEAVTLVSDGTDLTLTGTSAGSSFPAAAVNQISISDSGGSSNQTISFLNGTALALSAGLTTSGVETVSFNSAIDAGSADIDIVANNLAINAGASLVTTSTVTLQPQNVNRQINIGSENAGQLSLTDAELDRITAGLVQVGSSIAGPMFITAPISHANHLSLTNNVSAASTEGIHINAAVTMAADRNLTITAEGGPRPIESFNSGTNLVTSGTGAIVITAATGIVLRDGTALTTEDGGVTLSANAAGTATGIYAGLTLFGRVETTGAGSIHIIGRGSAGVQVGVNIQSNGLVRSTSSTNLPTEGTITIEGTGGSAINGNTGVNIAANAAAGVISNSGNISISGQGGLIGNAASVQNDGVTMSGGMLTVANQGSIVIAGAAGGNGMGVAMNLGVGPGSGIQARSDQGSILIEGTSGPAGPGSEAGVAISANGLVTVLSNSGEIRIEGDGASGVNGVEIGSATGPAVSSTSGNIIVQGVPGTADGFATLVSQSNFTTVISTPGTLRFVGDSFGFTGNGFIGVGAAEFVPLTPGIPISLGGADVLTTPKRLGLNNSELVRIRASVFAIGDATTGDISVDAEIPPDTNFANIARDMHLVSGGDIVFNAALRTMGNYGSDGPTRGNLLLSPGPTGSVRPLSSTDDVITQANIGLPFTTSFAPGADLAIRINGTSPHTQYDRLTAAGQIDLTNANLVISGSYAPAPGDSLLIVDNNGTDPIIGTFDGLSDGAAVMVNGVPMRIRYQGGDGNDVALESGGDFGDAPASYGTLLADDGARHLATGPLLGPQRDAEVDAQVPLNGFGDDTTGAPDDEEGVTAIGTGFTILAGSVGSATITINGSGGNARLYGWIDFNRDGDFADLGEQIALGETLLANGVQVINFAVPAGASAGTTFARFRVSTQAGLSFNGAATDGEVEDYALTIHSTVVTSNSDVVSDSDFGNSLREAILAANLWPGANTISFNIPGAGVQTISPLSALPAITDPVVIDGYTQPGAAFNTNPLSAGTNAVLLIELSGANAGPGIDGLFVTAPNTTILGLVINRFGGDGIELNDAGASGAAIVANFIGTDPSGAVDLGNLQHGLHVNGAATTQIGGVLPAARNLISGNDGNGIAIVGGSAMHNVIQGNLIGVNAAGTAALGNVGNGIYLEGSDNTIGGSVSGAGNVISGNSHGVVLDNASNNVLQGNYIGTDATGMGALRNEFHGVRIVNAPNNLIGGVTPGAGNVISGSTREVLFVEQAGSIGNVIQGNLIGTNAAGTGALPTAEGVKFTFGASDNQVGGTVPEARNVISGITGIAIAIWGAGVGGNVVQGNSVGTDVTGLQALPNRLGISIGFDAGPNQIGGSVVGAGNLISGNLESGIELFGTTAGSVIEGNWIGVDATGAAPLGNLGDGIYIQNASGHQIGGASPGAGNLIAASGGAGIAFRGSSATNNVVQGNVIGANADGSAALPNLFGLTFSDQASNNIVGGTAAGAGNLISGNSDAGIRISGFGGPISGMVIQNNLIGTDKTGMLPLGNGVGIFVGIGASNNTIGGPAAGERNVIAGNQDVGIRLTNDGTTGNVVQGNYIGTTIAGTGLLANQGHGILIDGATANLIGGGVAGAGNVVAGNEGFGILILHADAAGNVVQGNRIGVDALGNAAGNASGGLSTAGPNTTVGGTLPNEGNLIAHNGGPGIVIANAAPATAVEILGNSIHSNAGLGIDLEGDGPTANDSGDGDSGPNNLQNFPVLTAVGDVGPNTRIEGTLNSTPNTLFRVELFASDALDPSGFGEGQVYLGFVDVTTDAGGNATIDFLASGLIPPTQFITATATDPAGNTSEFSAPFVELIEISISDQTITEGDTGTTLAVFTVTLSTPSSLPVSVLYETADGTATAGVDYTATAGILSFAPMTDTLTITVPVSGDVLDESDENFFVNLSAAVGATISDGQGIGVIVDDEVTLPSLSVSDESTVEGDSAPVLVRFRVTLSSSSAVPVFVVYSTSDGAADASDYQGTSGTLTFAPGEVSKLVTVLVTGDLLDEFNEGFFLDLSSATNATLDDARGVATIFDNDPAPSLSISDQTVLEGAGGTVDAVFTVTLSAPSGLPVSVPFGAADGTAVAGADYSATTGVLSFAPSETVKTITVQVAGDLLHETSETFIVQLGGAVNADIADGQGIGTILNDDPPPGLAVHDLTILEGTPNPIDPGFDINVAAIEVSLSAPSGLPVTVIATTANGTADSSDYLPTTATLSFAPGTTRQFLLVSILLDALDEPDETFFVNLASPAGATFTDPQAVVLIADDDPAPGLSVNDRTVRESESGTIDAVFVVTLSAPSTFPISVEFTTVEGTASGDDYQPTSGTLLFAPFEVSKSITVRVNSDSLHETSETFHVQLSAPVNAQLADPQGVGTILDSAVPLLVVGTDAGSPPQVRVFNASTLDLLHDIAPYDAGFRGGVRVAAGDVTGDGMPDVITAAGPMGGSHVRVFDGHTGLPLQGALGSFFAYPGFFGGVFVAAGDVNADGHADIITGADAGGGPLVRVFDGRTGAPLPGALGSFLAYKSGLDAGVRVAAGDVNGDGHADVIVGMGPGQADDTQRLGFSRLSQTDVRVFSGTTGGQIANFNPFEPAYRGGVNLSAGLVDADNVADIVVGKANGDGMTDPSFMQRSVIPYRRAEAAVVLGNSFALLGRFDVGGASASVRLAVLDEVLLQFDPNQPHTDFLGSAILAGSGQDSTIAYFSQSGEELKEFSPFNAGAWVAAAGQRSASATGITFDLLFDESYYLRKYPDVASAVVAGHFSSGRQHYDLFGRFERREVSGLFDAALYLQQNPDVAAAIALGAVESAENHFIEFGQFENRPFSALFDDAIYRQQNPDVVAALNAGLIRSTLEHFLQFGQYEGRKASLLFDEQAYLLNYPDVAAAVAADLFPSGFRHFLIYGRGEGRSGV